MRTRYLVVTMLGAIIFVVIFALRAAGSPPESSVTPTESPPDQAAMAEQVEVQIGGDTAVSATVELAATQETQGQDSSLILEEHCSQCHTAESLEQIKQTRADWERSLAKMEGFGVKLDEHEIAVLLDYLAAAELP
jgi:cytochrome c5